MDVLEFGVNFLSVVFYNHRGPEHVFGGDDDEASFHVSGFVLNKKKITFVV